MYDAAGAGKAGICGNSLQEGDNYMNRNRLELQASLFRKKSGKKAEKAYNTLNRAALPERKLATITFEDRRKKLEKHKKNLLWEKDW